MLDDCCKSGFRWDGQPTGHEGTLASNQTYITGTSKDVAVLLIHDLFGWTLPNLRLLADHFAQEADCTVYVPDFYGGEVIGHDTLAEALTDNNKMKLLDLPGFIGRHSKDIRYPEILACAKALRGQYGKVGTVGYCWGGWACFRLASEEGLVDCAVMAHPSAFEKKEIDGAGVPSLIICPEFDTQSTEEMRSYYNRVIPGNGVPYRFDYFPGVAHGFAARGDRGDEKQREGLERAKRSVVQWFAEWLH